MSKQEEIIEGTAQRLFWTAFPTADWSVAVSQDYFRGLAKHLLIYLDSVGVVLKVERELPQLTYLSLGEIRIQELSNHCYKSMQDEMLKAGYVAVEPLIEEE